MRRFVRVQKSDDEANGGSRVPLIGRMFPPDGWWPDEVPRSWVVVAEREDMMLVVAEQNFGDGLFVTDLWSP